MTTATTNADRDEFNENRINDLVKFNKARPPSTPPTTQQPAPRPWRMEQSRMSTKQWIVMRGDNRVAIVDYQDAAALIVRAVNAHDGLVAALKSCMATIDSLAQDLQNGEGWSEGSEQTECCDESINAAREALKLAEA